MPSIARHALAALLVLAVFGLVGAAKAPDHRAAPSPFGPEPAAAPQLLAPGVISTGDDESHAELSPDGATLYFLKNSPTFDFWTIVTSRWNGSRWATPEVAPFSGQWSDADPFITKDGSRLYFISARPVDGTPRQDTDLWMVERTAGGRWSGAKHLGAALNSPESEWGPTVAENGTMYFGSEREGGRGGADIYRSRLVDGVYQTPENLGAPVNTPAGEYEPMVSPDERFIIFAAIGKKGNLGGFDLWITFNQGDRWSAPEHLPDPINSPGHDFGPKLTPDGRTLLFTSSRKAARAEPGVPLTYPELLSRLRSPGNGLRDIYHVSSSALPTAPTTH